MAFSAEVGADVRELCLEARFDGFLAKPADRAALRAELDRLVVSAGAGQCSAAAAYVAATGAAGKAGQQQRDFDDLGAGGIGPIEGAVAAGSLPVLAAEPAPRAGGSGGLEGLRVLAVDDNAICLKARIWIMTIEK